MPLSAFTNVFAGNPLDRQSARRADPDWVEAQLAHPDARAVFLWNGKPLVTGEPGARTIAWGPSDLGRELGKSAERLLFLGLGGLGPVFAVDLEDAADPAEGPLKGRGEFEDLRTAAPGMPLPETGILATARSLFEWRRRHRFCSNCGQPSEVVDGGWKRICPACRTQHFPRTDPCVIMLPTFGDRCLLGRQASWPAGRFSALAGFVEPGESIEEACAREVIEESGLEVVSVRHHSSQPWPFPSNLMIGLLAEVSNDQAAPQDSELEAVIWVSRSEARRLLEGTLDGHLPPGDIAIARQLLAAWAYESA
jgi:NAD+ diphosphatase